MNRFLHKQRTRENIQDGSTHKGSISASTASSRKVSVFEIMPYGGKQTGLPNIHGKADRMT
jgi:hypothetical protein